MGEERKSGEDYVTTLAVSVVLIGQRERKSKHLNVSVRSRFALALITTQEQAAISVLPDFN